MSETPVPNPETVCPFPGMDPYLEQPPHWGDFHATVIQCVREAIAEALPEEYVARLAEQANLVNISEHTRRPIVPDVAVDRAYSPELSLAASSGSAVATAEDDQPMTLPLFLAEQETEGYIEIVRLPDRELVTVVEVLSPSNKAGEGLRDYMVKRNAILKRFVHLVELDLLTAGERIPTLKPLPPADYLIVVSRHETRPDASIYPRSVRHRLPTIPIPLKAPDPDIRVDLAAVFAETYRRGRYGRSIDYGKPLPATLRPADKEWVAGLAKQAKEARDRYEAQRREARNRGGR